MALLGTDKEMLDEIAEALRLTGKSEAVRTAIRVYHALLIQAGRIKK